MDGCLSSAGDVYSFGYLVWEMVMGEPPFAGLGVAQVMYRVALRGHRPSLEGCPTGLMELVHACWQQESAARCVCRVVDNLRTRLPTHRPTFTVLLERITELLQEVDAQDSVV